ncbi:hypothetical protein [Algoriphagus sp. Y33]|uniref:hypothetical protein n=1 Tax=Algoriphagus sp. Y33 TaxID=2772483 RepID=UPI00177A8BA2|nr:hypothetical protein [Algoriphagus sp. Y33]
MKKQIYIQLILLFLAGWSQAQNFTGVWNASMVNDKSKVDPNIEYHLTQNGSTITGEIIHKKENMRATLTGTMANKEVTGTLKYDKNQWASLDQKFRIFIRANDNATMFMHESTKGARFYGGPIFKNQTLTSQQANKAQAATSLQKGAFSTGSGTVVQKATGTPKVGVQMATTPKKTARNIGGYYRIEGMTDASGTKRNLFVNVRNFPDSKDRSKAYGEALILGNAYGIGSTEGRLFGYETNEDDVTVMFDPIYENNTKNTKANGRIAIGSNGTYLVAPKLGYKMIKISQAEAERESKKLSATVKVRVEYKFIYVNDSFEWPKSALNSTQAFYSSFDRAIYGTGSIKATLETSSSTTPVKSVGNLSDRVFDAPKSRPVSKGYKSYYFEKKNNLAWGRGKGSGYGFYKFAKDAEFPKPQNNTHTGEFLIEVGYKREFEVPRAALEGKDQRVGIQVSVHLSNAAGTGDITFGNMRRKVYLHELGLESKLTEDEKRINYVMHEKRISKNPIYFIASVTKGPFLVTFVAFTVEIVE